MKYHLNMVMVALSDGSWRYRRPLFGRKMMFYARFENWISSYQVHHSCASFVQFSEK